MQTETHPNLNARIAEAGRRPAPTATLEDEALAEHGRRLVRQHFWVLDHVADLHRPAKPVRTRSQPRTRGAGRPAARRSTATASRGGDSGDDPGGSRRDLTQVAHDLHAQGFSVVPLEGKRPHARALAAVFGSADWKPLQHRRASAVELDALFQVEGASGVGIIVTSGLVIVDVDDPAAFKAAGLTHPACPTVRTARGLHLYFRGNVEGVHRLPWGEVRGTRSLVAAAGSLHPDGGAYSWLLDLGDVDMPLLPSWALPEAPPNRPCPRTTVGPRAKASETSLTAETASQPEAVHQVFSMLGTPEAITAEGRTREIRCLLPEHPRPPRFSRPLPQRPRCLPLQVPRLRRQPESACLVRFGDGRTHDPRRRPFGTGCGTVGCSHVACRACRPGESRPASPSPRVEPDGRQARRGLRPSLRLACRCR
ncbi:MAG: bifunctional DNA primase/polymerase [Solirubrobacteraceae bacterium]|nr:bifunctional DNA primase/polymerase [Solirubrobacteraceae bacterium]